MPNRTDYKIGYKIGKVIYMGEYSFGEGVYEPRRYVKLKCKCGNIIVRREDRFADGSVNGCGCHKHGNASNVTRTDEYKTWAGMKSRCNNTNVSCYKDYGAKGIKVCKRWNDSFAHFLLDMGKKPSKNHSIDRYPNMEGDYEPNNCRWATQEEQSKNRKHVHKYLYNGKILSLQELSKAVSINRKTLSQRINKLGWPLEKAIATRPKKKRISKFIPHSFGHIQNNKAA